MPDDRTDDAAVVAPQGASSSNGDAAPITENEIVEKGIKRQLSKWRKNSDIQARRPLTPSLGDRFDGLSKNFGKHKVKKASRSRSNKFNIFYCLLNIFNVALR